MIYFRTNTFVSHIRVQSISKIQSSRTLWQGLQFTLWGKDKYFRRKEIQFNGIQKIQGIRIGTFKNFGDCLKPFIQFRIFLNMIFLILPMRSKTFLCNVVHSATTDLYFYPLSVRTHYGEMQCLISISLRTTYPIPNTIRTDTVNIRNRRIDIPALILLIHSW